MCLINVFLSKTNRMQFYMLYTPKQQILVKIFCTDKIINVRQMVKFISFKTSQILEALNAAPIHNCLCEVKCPLFWDMMPFHWMICSWYFQTTQWSHLQSFKCQRTLGTNYLVIQHQIPKEQKPHRLSSQILNKLVKQENFRTHTIIQVWFGT